MVKPETARLIRHAIPVQRFCQRCVSISFHRVVLVADTPGMFLECPGCGALDILDPAVGHGLVWHGLPPTLKQEYDKETEDRKHAPALEMFGHAELGRIRAAVAAFPFLVGQVQRSQPTGETEPESDPTKSTSSPAMTSEARPAVTKPSSEKLIQDEAWAVVAIVFLIVVILVWAIFGIAKTQPEVTASQQKELPQSGVQHHSRTTTPISHDQAGWYRRNLLNEVARARDRERARLGGPWPGENFKKHQELNAVYEAEVATIKELKTIDAMKKFETSIGR